METLSSMEMVSAHISLSLFSSLSAICLEPPANALITSYNFNVSSSGGVALFQGIINLSLLRGTVKES